MTGTTTGLYFSVSGIGTARTSRLYHLLKDELKSDDRFTFVGNPFAGWKHPLVWAEEVRNLDSTTRLLNCWATLNEHVCKNIRPALNDGKIVITHRFGLDAVLYATALRDRAHENYEAEHVHHALVRMRIIEQQVRPPVYLIPCMQDLKKIRRDWMQYSPELKGVDEEALRNHVAYEKTVYERYFDPKKGQHPPHIFDAILSAEELLEMAISSIYAEIEKHEQAVA